MANDEDFKNSLTRLGVRLFRSTKELLTGVVISTTGVSRTLTDSVEWNQAVAGLGDRTALIAKLVAFAAWRKVDELIKKSKTLSLPSSVNMDVGSPQALDDTNGTNLGEVEIPEATAFEIPRNSPLAEYVSVDDSYSKSGNIPADEGLLCSSLMEMLHTDEYEEESVSSVAGNYTAEESVNVVSLTDDIEELNKPPSAIPKYPVDSSSFPKQMLIDTVLITDAEVTSDRDGCGIRAKREDFIDGEIVREFFKSSLWCSAVALGR